MAFRPGSDIGEVTPDPSVDVSAWEDVSDLHQDSTIQNDLDRPVDLTGHILSPFYRILIDFPSPKFMSSTETQQWLEILVEIYTYLCTTDERVRSALMNTGPRPFTLECRSPWGRGLKDPDTAPNCCLVSDVLIGVRVAIASDTLKTCRWLETKGVAVHDTRHARH